MEFIDSSDQIAKQVAEVREKLRQMEEEVTSKQALARLRFANNGHPVLMARTLFLVLTLLAVVAAAAVFGVSFLGDQYARQLSMIEQVVGLPLPLVILLLSLCTLAGWYAATQVALTLGADADLLPFEKKEQERLSGELARLARQQQLSARLHGTPMGGLKRLQTPIPSAQKDEGSLAGPGSSSPSYSVPSSLLAKPSLSQPSAAATASSGGGSSASSSARPAPMTPKPSLATPRTAPATPKPEPRRAPTPTPAKPPTPLGAPPRRGSNPVGTPMPAQPRGLAAPEPLLDDVLPEFEVPTDQYQRYDDDPEPLEGSLESYGNEAGEWDEEAPGADMSWSEVSEPWLIDAVEKSVILADQFPVQARIEYNHEPGLPFALVLERATPAMAVRAMMAYVEFLASISTPPRGRVLLVSIRSLDRSFHRNVSAALEPYFPGTFDVVKDGDAIDIEFHEPDRRWSQFPYLPTGE